jgi:hypothetical protein
MEECNKLKRIRNMKKLEERRELCGNYKFISIKNFDLSNKDLKGENFSNSNLKKVKFNNSDLRNSVFKDTRLEGANFTGANITNTDFKSSTFNDKTEGLIESFVYNNIYTQKKGLEDMRNLDMPLILLISILTAIFISITLCYVKKLRFNIF